MCRRQAKARTLRRDVQAGNGPTASDLTPIYLPEAVRISIIVGVPSIIKISRADAQWADRRRAYKVVIDGQVTGQIRRGKTGVFEVAAGHHELYLKIDWARSKAVDLELSENETSVWCCWSNARPLTALYWASVGRSRYLGLASSDAG